MTTLHASQISITSLNDSGPGTLRNALANLTSGDTIQFNANLSGTLLLQSALPDINADVNIFGPASGNVTVDGNSTHPFLNVLGGVVSIQKLNFANGVKGSQAGAIYVSPTLTMILKNVNITPTSNPGGDNPIYIDGDAMLKTHGVAFSTNTIPEIYLNEGILEVKDSDTHTSEFIIDGIGSAWVKDGEVATLKTASSSPVSITIVGDSGTAIFNGTTTEPCISNLTNGSLYGEYTCLYVTNGGTAMPGNATTRGVNTTDADWAQIQEGNLHIKLYPNGEADRIIVGATASIAGTLTLVPASGSYTQGTTYEFMTTSSGNVSGTFHTVTSTVPGLDFEIHYHPKSIVIEILSDFSI
jgi:hypothetical protein